MQQTLLIWRDAVFIFPPETLNAAAQRKILGELPSRMPEKGEAVLRSPNERLAIGAVRQFFRNEGR